VVGRLARTELGVNADPTVEVVRYPREGSCVMRYDFAGSMSLYGKVYADDSGLIVESFLNAMDRAQADDRHVTESRYPSPVLFDRALKLLVTSELAGEPLAERISRALAADDDEDAAPSHPELESAVHAAGRALAALHDSDMATAPTYTVTQELDDLRRQLQMVTYTWPNLGKDLRRHVELLTAVAPSAPDLVLSHGDFTPSQVLMDDDRPALVDLDGLCWADPTRDLGRFMAQLDLLVSKTRGTRSRSTVEDLVDAFLRGYRDGNPRVDHDPGFASRVAFYRRASLLRSALHARRQLKPARHDLAMSLFASQGMPSGGNR
jgi:aminoglycoside phosphotransferase